MEHAAVRRFKDQWRKLASGLYVPLLLNFGHWYHGMGKCCCKCTIFKDAFNRADSSNLGGNWIEHLGSWEILGEQLQTASADALVQCLVEGNDDPHVVTANLKGTAVGDQIRLIANYRTTTDYWFAELEYGAVDSTVKLFKKVGGSDTQVGNTYTLTNITVADPPISLDIRFHTSGVCVVVRYSGSEVTIINDVNGALTDSFTGFGTGDLTGTATFENGLLLRYHSELQSECPHCDIIDTECGCSADFPVVGSSTLPLKFAGVAAGTCADCADYNTATFNLTMHLCTGEIGGHTGGDPLCNLWRIMVGFGTSDEDAWFEPAGIPAGHSYAVVHVVRQDLLADAIFVLDTGESPVDCSVQRVLPYSSGVNDLCDWTGATATLFP